MKTQAVKKNQIETKWHLIDATDQALGRLSTTVSKLLMGKNKVAYSPNLVCGDKVVVINTDKIKITGNKLLDKMYYSHSGFGGGFKQKNMEYHMTKDSTFVVKESVKGMLPISKLRNRYMANLYLYKGADHSHTAQIKL